MKLHRLPRSLPPARLLLADLGHPTAAELAAGLGVSERTVWRWRAEDQWPRPAHLSLFFASRYGFSVVESEALHQLRTGASLVRALSDQVRRLRGQLEHVQALAEHGAANAPLYAT